MPLEPHVLRVSSCYSLAMLTVRRASTYVLASLLGFVTGWLGASVGGSFERAPTALVVIAVGLGSTGLVIGVILGLIEDKPGTVLALVLALSSFYFGTWMISPFHSIAGDILFVAVSAFPVCIGAIVGFAASGGLRRRAR